MYVRQGHPIEKSQAELEDFESYEIASFITPGWNDTYSVAEQLMSARGLKTKVGFRSELIMAIISVVQKTDMYMPHSNLFPIEQYPDLRAIDVLIDDDLISSSLYSQCHIKDRNNPVIHWLHALLQESLQYQVDKAESQIPFHTS